jgi:3-oxoacyl-[acyl-carrier-protein] synthase-1
MRKVFFGNDNIISSLGFTSGENAENLAKGMVGIRIIDDPEFFPGKAAYSAVNTEELETRFLQALTKRGLPVSHLDPFTRLEKMFVTSISQALADSSIKPSDPRTVMIISSTKGNIDSLTRNPEPVTRKPRLLLWKMANHIAQLFNCSIVPVVVSNACTSGSLAIIHAARLIASGKYDHAIVTGGDIVSEFVISGFQSFQALSPAPCKPFDANRSGLSLGEGVGTVILTADPEKAGSGVQVVYRGGATSNDANHISGPSRDGEGLYLSIAAALKEAGLEASELDYISAHGTATPYNDEMESLALNWAGLEQTPVNSFKGYLGHTLGAAGVIETVLSIYSMRNNLLFKSIGYETHGVSKPLNIITETTPARVDKVLKTASGFGGCNAAIVITVNTLGVSEKRSPQG